MGGLKWEVAPQIIIIAVTSNTQYGNLTKYGSNILNRGPHRRQCSDYYSSLNKVLDMIDLVNPNDNTIHFTDFVFLVNPNGTKKDRQIGIYPT